MVEASFQHCPINISDIDTYQIEIYSRLKWNNISGSIEIRIVPNTSQFNGKFPIFAGKISLYLDIECREHLFPPFFLDTFVCRLTNHAHEKPLECDINEDRTTQTT